jgi:ATP-dependent Lon protease
VLRVGGIKEKVLAAARAGLKDVILPETNRGDWTDVPDEVRKSLKVHFVKDIAQLISVALVK